MRKKASYRLVPLATAAMLVSALTGVASAQPVLSSMVSVRSVSGQFIAYARRTVTLPPALLAVATNQTFVQLEPTLVTVSCERIKQLLLRELGVTTPWQSAIYLVLYPARSADDTITITSERFNNGWQYRVDVPDVVERSRYVRGIVQVLLFELANRTAQTRAVDVPLWLVEGFTQMLLGSNEFEIILPPPRAKANGLVFSAALLNARRKPLLEQVQKYLRGRPPMTFEKLSWPPAQVLASDAGDLYRGSAQLFVGELLELPEGREGLQRMLCRLPQYYNWQFAFLGAFYPRFQRPLDVEKWWSLSVIAANGRDPAQAWPAEESWQNFNRAIRLATQDRVGTNEPPSEAQVTLQTVIREWDPARQAQALNNTLRELGLLRLRIAQEYVGLVQDYCRAIEIFLQRRDPGPSATASARRTAQLQAAQTAVVQLDALDARREAMRPAPKPATRTPSPALPVTARQSP